MKRIVGRVITSLAMLYALNTGLTAQVKDTTTNEIRGSASTETSITPSGIPMHGTHLNIGPVAVRQEINKTNVTAAFLDDIVKRDNFNMNGAVFNVGNYDGKDEVFFDITSMANINNITYGLEGGSSLRKTSVPRQFAIGTIENIPVGYEIKTSLEGSLLTKDPLNKEKGNNYYGWVAAYNDKLFASGAYTLTDKQVFTGINTKDFGQFTWYKGNANGTWQIKTRTAFGDVDEKFYNSSSEIATTRLFTLPQFFDIHLKPSQSRGNYTLGFDVTSGKDGTTTRVIPGAKTPVGYLGFGAESKSSSNTGIYASYYNKFNILGLNTSVEVNYNGRVKDTNGYVTLNADLGK